MDNVNNGVSLKEIIDELNLRVVYMPEGALESVRVDTPELNRPGLQLAGYFDYFAFDRIQIIGKTEFNYFKGKPNEERREILNEFFSYDFPAIIFTHGEIISENYIEYAKMYSKPLLATDRVTTKLMNKLSYFLDSRLAAKETIHAVFVDVFGVGVLLKGDSGIGKSETALELIQRGHRLVADDAVEIRHIDDNIVTGAAPPLLRYFMEIRGIGIIDVKSLYGAGAVRESKAIDLVVYLEEWDNTKYYDRVGLDKDYEELLGVDFEKVVIPVRPGRNVSMVIEVAAMNYRQRRLGYDSAREFTDKLQKMIYDNE